MQLPSEQDLSRAAAAIAALGCVLLVFEHKLPASRALRGFGALGLAFAGVFSYYQFFSIPVPAFFHRWEMFHYVLGAKYAPELEYERLYRCVAVADAANGHRDEVLARPMRDLHDDAVVSAASALREPERCTDHFEPARWRQFQKDVGTFRSLVGDRTTWAAMQLDHGYNPSPVWTLLGGVLANSAPVGAALLRRLALIDPCLMIASLGLLAWAFGPRIAWLAGLFWSTQAPSSFAWTGGAFLRQDWLFLAIAASACLRKRQFGSAGACLAWSALLRVFPIVFFFGPIVLATSSWVHRRKVADGLPAFFFGAVLAALLLFGATLGTGAGVKSYRDFGAHLYMHSKTPIANHMSLRSLFSFAPGAQQPARSWEADRRARLAARFPFYALSAALITLAVLRCIWNLRTPWIALGLCFPIVMVVSDPSSYYFSMVVLLAPLARARRSVAVMLLGLAAAGQMLMLHVRLMDARFAAMSALYLLFAVVLVLVFSRPLWIRTA